MAWLLAAGLCWSSLSVGSSDVPDDLSGPGLATENLSMNRPTNAHDTLPADEAERRAEALARAVLSLPPQRQKDVRHPRGVSKRKAGKAPKPSPSKPS